MAIFNYVESEELRGCREILEGYKSLISQYKTLVETMMGDIKKENKSEVNEYNAFMQDIADIKNDQQLKEYTTKLLNYIFNDIREPLQNPLKKFPLSIKMPDSFDKVYKGLDNYSKTIVRAERVYAALAEEVQNKIHR